jgi:hypothetical protein
LETQTAGSQFGSLKYSAFCSSQINHLSAGPIEYVKIKNLASPEIATFFIKKDIFLKHKSLKMPYFQ